MLCKIYRKKEERVGVSVLVCETERLIVSNVTLTQNVELLIAILPGPL